MWPTLPYPTLTSIRLETSDDKVKRETNINENAVDSHPNLQVCLLKAKFFTANIQTKKRLKGLRIYVTTGGVSLQAFTLQRWTVLQFTQAVGDVVEIVFIAIVRIVVAIQAENI